MPSQGERRIDRKGGGRAAGASVSGVGVSSSGEIFVEPIATSRGSSCLGSMFSFPIDVGSPSHRGDGLPHGDHRPAQTRQNAACHPRGCDTARAVPRLLGLEGQGRAEGDLGGTVDALVEQGCLRLDGETDTLTERGRDVLRCALDRKSATPSDDGSGSP